MSPALLALLCTACGDKGGDDSSASADDTADTMDTEDDGVCADETRGVDLGQGTGVAGAKNLVTLSVDKLDPDPPARSNSWTFTLIDNVGTPVNGATIAGALWMPDHNHGSSDITTTELGSGKYRLDTIILTMPGYWELTLDVTLPGGAVDQAVLGFCYEG